MQSGARLPAIVQSMDGLSAYRGSYATYIKHKAHRAHRSRVKRDLKLVVREVIDVEEFEPSPNRGEQANAWDIW